MITSKAPEAAAFLASADALQALVVAGGATTLEATCLIAYACLKLHVDPDHLAMQVMKIGLGSLIRMAAEPQPNVPGGKA